MKRFDLCSTAVHLAVWNASPGRLRFRGFYILCEHFLDHLDRAADSCQGNFEFVTLPVKLCQHFLTGFVFSFEFSKTFFELRAHDLSCSIPLRNWICV